MKLALKLASIHLQHIYPTSTPSISCLSLAPKTAVPPRFCYKIIKKNRNGRSESLLSPNSKTKQSMTAIQNMHTPSGQ